MKNLILIILTCAVAVLGFLYYNASETPKTNNGPASTNGQVSNAKDAVSYAGKGLENLPMSLFENNTIVELDVSNNNLTGALPAEIRNLTKLEILNASNNTMTGIPAEIGQLRSLKVADFSYNDISGLPLEIGNLNSLEKLDLRGNPRVSRYDLERIRSTIPNAEILVD